MPKYFIPLDVRITVFDAFAQNVLILDACADSEIGNNGTITYENTPTGCGAAEIPLSLTYSEIVAKGYWRAYNIVEISTADNIMTASLTMSGATKIYLDSNAAFRSGNDPDTQQVYFYGIDLDTSTLQLCMLVPVTGHGTDGGGDFITIGAPAPGGGNPAFVPRYSVGTYVGRRRWSGRIMRRQRPNQKNPLAKVTLVGWGASSSWLDRVVDSFTITETDHGKAVFECLSNAMSGRPEAAVFTISGANFPTIDAGYSSTLSAHVSIGDTKWYVNSTAGLVQGNSATIGSGGGAETRIVYEVSKAGKYFTTTHAATKTHGSGDAVTVDLGDGFTGSLQNSQLSQMINQILAAIPTGDTWVVRTSHDRTPRLLQLYIAALNQYTYTKILPQGVTSFEPVGVEADDEDASNMFNSIEVSGNTDPTTGQPTAAIVQDPESMKLYGQVDAVPVTVTGLATVDDCASLGQALLNQSSIPVSNNKCRVYVQNNSTNPSGQPAGLAVGDVLTGVEAVVITRFDDTGTVRNMVPDSEVQYPTGPDALWTALNGGLTQDPTGGPTTTGCWKITGTGSAFSQQQEYGQVIDVVPGQTYTFSGWFNGSHLTSGGPSWDIYDPTVTTRYAAIQATPGNTGVVSTTWTCPNGVYQVVIVANARTATVQNGQPFRWAQPMFQPGTSVDLSGGLPAYTPNYATPNLYGLVASAVTTIDMHGDRYQDIKFAAVEPDWTAEMAERAHGLANALRNNQKTPVQIDQYCVSVDAYPYNSKGHLSIPSTGMTVNPPNFLALFAPNTNVKNVIDPTFSVAPNSTNQCWLNPDLSWTILQTPLPVAGSIRVYMIATDGSKVIGVTQTAPVGLLTSDFSGPNLIDDPAFEHVQYYNGTKWVNGYNSSGRASRDRYWTTYEMKVGFPEIYYGKPGRVNGAGTVQILSDAFGSGNGANGRNVQVMSECVTLEANTQYCFSAYVDASSSTGGSLPGCRAPSIALISQDHATTLSAGSSAGATTFHVHDIGQLAQYDVVRIGTGSAAENLEISTVSAGQFTTTAGALNAHSNNDPVDMFWDFQANDPFQGSGYHPQDGRVLAEISQTLGDRSIIFGVYTPSADTIVSLLYQSHGSKVTGIQVFGLAQLQTGSAPGPFFPHKKQKEQVPYAPPINFDDPTGSADPQDGALQNEGGGYSDHWSMSWQSRAVLSDTRDGGDGLIMLSGQVNARHVNAGQIQNQHGAAMPGAILSAGPNITSASATFTSSFGGTGSLAITFTEGDFGATPTWLDSIIIRLRTHAVFDYRQELRLDPRGLTYASGAGTLTAKIMNPAAGDTVDVGFAYRDISGAISATVWPSAVSNLSDPKGAVFDATSGNMVRPLLSGIPIAIGGPQILSGSGVPSSTPSVPAIDLRTDPTDFRTILYVYLPGTGWSAVSGDQTTATATEASQSYTTTATQLFASSIGRIGATITNKGNVTLYVGTDNTTSATKFMAAIPPRGSWSIPSRYTGDVWGIWDAGGAGQASVVRYPS